MAEEINLEVNITAGNGKKTVAEVRKELEDTQKVAKSTGDSLSQGLGTAEKAAGSLKSQLKAMMMELGTLDESSPRFKQLTKDAGALKDKISDISTKVGALASDTKKLDALVGFGSAVAGGFQAAQGAMALFGTDSVKVQKAIQNIIAVQGILNGVQQVGQYLTTKGIVQDGLAATARLLLTGTTVKQTAAQIALNGAMIANPIGIVIVAVAALAAGVVYLIQKFEKAIYFFQAMAGIFNTQAAIEAVEEGKKAERRKAESEAHKKRLAEIDEQKKARIDAADKTISALELEKDTLEANGESSEAVTVKILEAELEKTKAVLDANKEKIQSWIDYYTNLAALSGESDEAFKARMKNQGIDLDLLQQKANDLIIQNEASVQRSENAITKFKREQNEERSADAQAAFEEAEALRLAEVERLKQEAEAQLEFDEMIRQRNNDADKLFNERLLAEKEERLNAEFDLMEENIDRENALKEQQLEIDKQTQQAKFDIAKNLAQSTIDLAKTVFTLTNRFGKQDEAAKEKRAKRQFEISKALSISEATISTINGVVNALSAKSMIPEPYATVLRVATAAGVAAAGAANIAQIASSKFGAVSNPTTSTGGGDVSASISDLGSTEPNVNPINAGSTFLNQEKTQQVLVVEDVNSMQKKVKAIEGLASFG